MNTPSFESKNSKINKLTFQLKKVAILCGLFLVLFAASFYAVNLMQVKPSPRVPQFLTVPSQNLKDNNQQLAKSLGSTNVSMADFDAWAKANNLTGDDLYNSDPDGDGIPNQMEYIYGIDPLRKDTDGDGFTDKQEIANGYDPDAPGEAKPLVNVKIDKLNVSAPMVWTQSNDEKAELQDLDSGLSHFYGSAAPGQIGNSIISGHSSNYIWSKGKYNYIFKDLNNLEKGDTISIQTIQRNGRIMTYQYRVNDKYIAAPDDEKIFADSSSPTITLSTCWPLGTNLKRLIIKAEILQQ